MLFSQCFAIINTWDSNSGVATFPVKDLAETCGPQVVAVAESLYTTAPETA